MARCRLATAFIWAAWSAHSPHILLGTRIAVEAASHLQVMTWYGCDPVGQESIANVCISAENAVLRESSHRGMRGMKSVIWSFFQNAKPPRRGLQLRPDYLEGWQETWSGQGELYKLSQNGTVMGVFLGDELLGSGVNVSELTIAAQTVKKFWPRGIVYWNEEWGPVVQNSTWPNRASALHRVPAAIDWISLDFYRRDDTAWTTPKHEYNAQVYPKMQQHQRALLVPQAFGRKHDICGNVCYVNTSEHGCCRDNHGPGEPWASGQTNHSFEWWDHWSATVAYHYYEWAQQDPMVIGINPWYWGEDRADISCGGNNISGNHLPSAKAAWSKIGHDIVSRSRSE